MTPAHVAAFLNRLGGIELSSAYTCIKAISKKKLPTIAKFREEFISGATKQGLKKDAAEELFGMIEKFAGYGFNKSHSTAYALIAYMTAYLKAHYPVEFMAALLSGDIAGRNFKKKDALVEHLEDCRRMEITANSPSVNLSEGDFTVGNGQIHIGLCAIKGCGRSAADGIVAARQKGVFKDIFDFCERVDSSLISRATIETLIKAGAMDCFGARRSQLMAVVERAVQGGASKHADRRSGQKGLFDDVEEDQGPVSVSLPDLPESEQRDLLAGEKEVLGFYLSSHPLAEHEQMLNTYCSHTTVDIANLQHKTEVTLGGMISAIKISQVKNPRPGATSNKYAMFDLEDMQGIVRCILWSEGYGAFGELVRADATLVIRGAVDRRPGSEEANLVVNEIIPLEEVASRFTKGIAIRISEEQHGPREIDDLYEILRGYPGTCDVQLVVCLADGRKAYLHCDRCRVALSPEMRGRIDTLLGPGNFRLIAAPPKPSASFKQNGRSREFARR